MPGRFVINVDKPPRTVERVVEIEMGETRPPWSWWLVSQPYSSNFARVLARSAPEAIADSGMTGHLAAVRLGEPPRPYVAPSIRLIGNMNDLLAGGGSKDTDAATVCTASTSAFPDDSCRR